MTNVDKLVLVLVLVTVSFAFVDIAPIVTGLALFGGFLAAGIISANSKKGE